MNIESAGLFNGLRGKQRWWWVKEAHICHHGQSDVQNPCHYELCKSECKTLEPVANPVEFHEPEEFRTAKVDGTNRTRDG